MAIDCIVIKPQDSFEFEFHREFRADCDAALQGKFKRVKIDLTTTTYIDNSALGMLLILKDRAAAEGMDVALYNAHDQVKAVLDLACFEQRGFVII